MNICICFDLLNTCNRIFSKLTSKYQQYTQMSASNKKSTKVFCHVPHENVNEYTNILNTHCLQECFNPKSRMFYEVQISTENVTQQMKAEERNIRILMEKNRIYFHDLFRMHSFYLRIYINLSNMIKILTRYPEF